MILQKETFLIGLITFSIAACTCQKKTSETIPSWLENKIEALASEPVQNPPASVYEYIHRGQVVYYFPAPCCDQFSMLFDKKGVLLCHPDGGITGKGDGECPDFIHTRSNEKLIWKDERTE